MLDERRDKRGKPHRSTGQRLKLMLVGALLMSVSLLVGLLLCEGIVRLVAPQQLIEYRADVYKGVDSVAYEHQPNLQGLHVNTGEKAIQLYTDADGFRVAPTGRLKADKNILLVGDSFMQALQVDYPESVAGLLEARLPAKIGEPVGVRNTGVAGFGVNAYAIKARRQLDRERFQLAIVTVTLENDEEQTHKIREAITPHMGHEFHIPGAFRKDSLVQGFAYPLNDFLETRSHLFLLVRHAFQVFLMHRGLSPLPLPVWYYADSVRSPAWDTSAVILNDAAIAADAHHVPIIFVLLPSSFQVDSADFNRYVRGFHVDPKTVDLYQPNRLFTERLERIGRTVIDATPALRAAVEKGVRTHGRFDPHLTPAGHLIVEQLIEPTVVKLMQAGADSGKVMKRE